MSNGESYSPTPVVTAHATNRWEERMPGALIDVETAWINGVTVDAPECDCDSTKLYPPMDALLLRKNSRIVTVLPADYSRIDTAELVQCANCGCATKLHRSQNNCEWCDQKMDAERLDGSIRIF